MLTRGELAIVGAEQADREEDRADDHVGAVEPGRHEEGRRIDAPCEAELRVRVLVALAGREQQAEHDGEPEAVLQPLAVALQQGVMRPGDGRAGREQDESVEQRQVPRVERLDALGRPDAAGERDAGGLDRVRRVEGGLEEGPEPRHEEHHLGGDEHHHAVAMVELHDAGVVARIGLVRHVLPPREHGVEHADRAEAEDVGARRERADGQALHPEHGAEGHQEAGEGPDQRPGARVEDVEVVILGVRLGHRPVAPHRRAPNRSRPYAVNCCSWLGVA